MVWHFRAWRKSFPERFGISAHGESRFPSGLTFPRLAKVISRKVWHFRAWRKSFPEWFGISAHGESHFLKGLAFPRMAKVIFRRVWRVRESFVYKNEKIDEVGKVRLWHLTQKPTIKLSSLGKCVKPHSKLTLIATKTCAVA